MLVTVNEVVYRGETHDARVHSDCPIHGDRRYRCSRREEGEDEDRGQVAQGTNVDEHAPAAEAESKQEGRRVSKCFRHGQCSTHQSAYMTTRERLTTDALEEDTPDDDHVGCQE